MKQVLVGLTTLVLSVSTLGSYVSAQSKEDIIAYVTNSLAQAYELMDGKNFTAAYANDVSIKAKRNFAKSFENITDEKWYRIKGGYFASFSKNNIKTEVYYNNRGIWLYNLLIYHEDELSSQVRNLIRSTYHNYAVLLAYECQFLDRPVYIIKLKNTKTYKTVLVYDDEMHTIEEFTDVGS